MALSPLCCQLSPIPLGTSISPLNFIPTLIKNRWTSCFHYINKAEKSTWLSESFKTFKTSWQQNWILIFQPCLAINATALPVPDSLFHIQFPSIFLGLKEFPDSQTSCLITWNMGRKLTLAWILHLLICLFPWHSCPALPQRCDAVLGEQLLTLELSCKHPQNFGKFCNFPKAGLWWRQFSEINREPVIDDLGGCCLHRFPLQLPSLLLQNIIYGWYSEEVTK